MASGYYIKNEALKVAFKIIEGIQEKTWMEEKELHDKLPECLELEEVERIRRWGEYKQKQGEGNGLTSALLAISDLDEEIQEKELKEAEKNLERDRLWNELTELEGMIWENLRAKTEIFEKRQEFLKSGDKENAKKMQEEFRNHPSIEEELARQKELNQRVLELRKKEWIELGGNWLNE